MKSAGTTNTTDHNYVDTAACASTRPLLPIATRREQSLLLATDANNSYISLAKAGSESKRYLLKALKKTASLRVDILKDAFRLRRFAVSCPHSIHSFNRFERKSAPGCQPSSSAPTMLRALLPCLRHHVLCVCPLVDLLHPAAPACCKGCSCDPAACMQQFQGIFYCIFAWYCSGHRRPQNLHSFLASRRSMQANLLLLI